MASRSESYEANRDYRRLNDVKVEDGTNKAIQAIAVAHLGQGNLTEFKVAMSSLGKVDSLAAIKSDVVDIKAVLTKLLDGLGSNASDGG